MSLVASTARFNAKGFAVRQATNPVTITAAGLAAPLAAAKSPTRLRRVQNEHGTGWVQQAHATFNLPGDGAFLPKIGADFTITASQTADEIGTKWRCYDLSRANPATARDHRCGCFRLD